MCTAAFRIIDVGPDGGDNGGRVIAFGRPEQAAAQRDSYTGQFLAEPSSRAPPAPRDEIAPPRTFGEDDCGQRLAIECLHLEPEPRQITLTGRAARPPPVATATVSCGTATPRG